MSNDRIGMTIIDALSLRDVAEGVVLDELRKINYQTDFDVFTLFRTMGRIYHQHFDVMLKGKKVASVYF